MKKRTYYTTDKRKKLVAEAMDTVSKTRETLDPALLARVRDAIGSAADEYQSDKFKKIQADRVPVDHKKNLTIVLKYLELNPGNKAVRQEVMSYLTQH